MYQLSSIFIFSRLFSQSWTEYCSETIEKLLDVDVELSCLENKLLFCYDPSIEKAINGIQNQHHDKQFDCIDGIQGLQKDEYKDDTIST